MSRHIDVFDERYPAARFYRDPSWLPMRMSAPWPGKYRKSPRHLPLWAVLAQKRVRASMAGYRAMPNKNGRHFTILSPEMLDARRQGVPGRVMRGQPA